MSQNNYGVIAHGAHRHSKHWSIADWLISSIDMVGIWRQRLRQRRHLASLDDRLLRDVGLTRADATRETAKPFWR